MAFALKQSTAGQEVPLGYFVDSTDGNTEETGLTIANTDVKIHKEGATTLANKNSGGGTHISNGIYYIVLDATDTATVGNLTIFVHVTGALPVIKECYVYEEAIFDALFGASAAGFDSSGRVDVGSWLGTAVTTSSTSAKPQVDVFSISDDATAADNHEAMLDGTGSVTLTTAISGNITGNLSGSVGSVTGNVGGTVSELGTQAKADVNAEVLDVMNTDTFTEPSQGAPPASPTIRQMCHYLYKAWRNRNTTDATNGHRVYADNGTTIDHEASVSDDGTTFDRGEFGTGA